MSSPPVWTNVTLPLSVQRLNLQFVNDSAISYKALAEAFVTGHTGSGGFGELTLLLVSVGMWIWIHRIITCSIRRAAQSSRPSLLRLLPPSAAARRAGSFTRLLVPLLLEYALLVWPVLFSMTLGADWAAYIFAAQLIAIVGLLVRHRVAFGESLIHLPAVGRRPAADAAAGNSVECVSSDAAVLHRLNHSPKLFITNYRTSLMIYTSIAILAVDFVVFPRRFCKSETFGIGMMDGGVGSFIISHAITSIHARGRGAGASNKPSRNLFAQLWHIIRSILPLVALGVARLFTIKAVEYQEHVSEYGVHWNFFFTLAAVALLSGALSSRIHPRSASWAGMALLLAYQLSLSLTPLTEYIMTAPRVSLLSANKEGLASSIGYFALYLCAVRIGHEVLGVEKDTRGWWAKLGRLVCVDVAVWLLALASHELVQPSSRRMVNLSYGMWMIGTNLLQLIQCMMLDMMIVAGHDTCNERTGDHRTPTAPPSKHIGSSVSDSATPTEDRKSKDTGGPSIIIEAVNKNSLPFFLLCNLCTGAINLSMYTIFASDALAMAVLSAYTLVTCTVVVYFDYRGWIIKL